MTRFYLPGTRQAFGECFVPESGTIKPATLGTTMDEIVMKIGIGIYSDAVVLPIYCSTTSALETPPVLLNPRLFVFYKDRTPTDFALEAAEITSKLMENTVRRTPAIVSGPIRPELEKLINPERGLATFPNHFGVFIDTIYLSSELGFTAHYPKAILGGNVHPFPNANLKPVA